MKTLLLLCALTLLLAGCDQTKPVQAAKPEPKQTAPATLPAESSTKQDSPRVHRFVVVAGHPDLALDTQTGQLCRTAEWLAHSSHLAAPTCKSLYDGDAR